MGEEALDSQYIEALRIRNSYQGKDSGGIGMGRKYLSSHLSSMDSSSTALLLWTQEVSLLEVQGYNDFKWHYVNRWASLRFRRRLADVEPVRY